MLGDSELRLRRIRSYVETADQPLTAEAVAKVTEIPIEIVETDLIELWQREQIGARGGNPPAYR